MLYAHRVTFFILPAFLSRKKKMDKNNHNPPAYADVIQSNGVNAAPMPNNVPNYAVSGSWNLISYLYLSWNTVSIVAGITDHSYAVPNQPVQSSTTYVTIDRQDISIVGRCSACRIGVMEDNYPCWAICCAIFQFPIGLFLCLHMKNKQCSHCGVQV